MKRCDRHGEYGSGARECPCCAGEREALKDAERAAKTDLRYLRKGLHERSGGFDGQPAEGEEVYVASGDLDRMDWVGAVDPSFYDRGRR